MPRYYCDYCDTYLTHDSPSVRKQHNAGYKHKANVRSYYQQFEEQQTQSLIDQRIKEHLGQAAAYHQVGATFNQHLMSFPGNPQRPRLPILPPPLLPMGASPQGPGMYPGMRPPVLPLPVGSTPGYGGAPNPALSMLPPGATSMPMQMNNLPRPPPMMNPPPMMTTGMTTTSTSNGAALLTNLATYQANPSFNSGAPAAAPTSQEGFSYNQNSETSH